MALLRINTNLTHGESDFHTQAAITHRGQAHFAGTGPAGMTFGSCVLYGGGKGNRRQPCRKFRELTGKAGPLLPKDAQSCKYYEGTGVAPISQAFGMGEKAC